MDTPCFVVSLKSATDRRERTAQEFAREGIAFEFIDAIDGRQFTPDRTPAHVSPTFGLPMVPGDIACTMSHGLAMKTMLVRGYKRALIFEDDAMLATNFAPWVAAMLSAPVEWDVLKLCGAWPEARRVQQHNDTLFVWPVMPSLLNQGYAITAAGANKLIPYTDPAFDLFDHVVQHVWRTKVNLVEVFPRPVTARHTPTTIERGAVYLEPAPRTMHARLRRSAYKARRSIWKRLRI